MAFNISITKLFDFHKVGHTMGLDSARQRSPPLALRVRENLGVPKWVSLGAVFGFHP